MSIDFKGINDSVNWKQEVEKFLENPLRYNQLVHVMYTPLVYCLIDKTYLDITPNFPIKIAPSIIKKVLISNESEGGHANKIKPELFKKLPILLANPIMIMKNRNGRTGEVLINELLIMAEAKDNIGATINIPIIFKKDGGSYNIKSFFGRNSILAIEKKILLGDVLYINKEKTTSWKESIGQQWPKAFSISGSFGNNIPNEKDLVNLETRKTQEFIEEKLIIEHLAKKDKLTTKEIRKMAKFYFLNDPYNRGAALQLMVSAGFCDTRIDSIYKEIKKYDVSGNWKLDKSEQIKLIKNCRNKINSVNNQTTKVESLKDFD